MNINIFPYRDIKEIYSDIRRLFNRIANWKIKTDRFKKYATYFHKCDYGQFYKIEPNERWNNNRPKKCNNCGERIPFLIKLYAKIKYLVDRS